MILYCAAIPVHIYPLLMHKIGMNPNKDAVLFIDKVQFEKRNDLNAVHSFKDQGIFTDVVDCNLFIDQVSEGDDTEKKCLEHFNSVFDKSGYKIISFEQIYVFNDSWDGDINIYFNLKKSEYVWVECVKNYIPQIYTSIEWRKKLMLKYSYLTPFAKYAKPCLLVNSDRTMSLLKSKQKHFTVWDLDYLYENISVDNLEKIGECFNIEETSEASSSTLIIKNSGAICDRAFDNWVNLKEQIEILFGRKQYNMDDYTPFFDKIAIDFYVPKSKNIFIKEHPNCPINQVQQEIYNEELVALTKMPFEFLTKYFALKNIKFDSIIGYLSTSLDVANESICNHLYALGKNFFRTGLFYCSIYVALCYAEYCNFKYIYCSEMIKSQLEFLIKTVDFKIELKKINLYDLLNLSEIKDALIISDYVLEKSVISKDFFSKVHTSTTMCFLNVDLTEEFFDDVFMPNFIPIEIKKEKIAEGFLNLHRDEILWIFTKNTTVLKNTRFFEIEKLLPRCGLRVYVKENTLANGLRLFQDYSYRQKINDITKQHKTLSNIVKYTADKTALSKVISEEINISQYFELLKLFKSDYLIILSIRDTPGNNLHSNVVQAVHELGFKKFSKELWQMYVGVSNCGRIACDTVGECREAPVNYSCCNPLYGMDISVSSMAWRQGNKSEIVINGIDYSANIRGLNVVVYDLAKRQLIDSVGFDWHDLQSRFVRKTINQ